MSEGRKGLTHKFLFQFLGFSFSVIDICEQLNHVKRPQKSSSKVIDDIIEALDKCQLCLCLCTLILIHSVLTGHLLTTANPCITQPTPLKALATEDLQAQRGSTRSSTWSFIIYFTHDHPNQSIYQVRKMFHCRTDANLK